MDSHSGKQMDFGSNDGFLQTINIEHITRFLQTQNPISKNPKPMHMNTITRATHGRTPLSSVYVWINGSGSDYFWVIWWICCFILGFFFFFFWEKSWLGCWWLNNGFWCGGACCWWRCGWEREREEKWQKLGIKERGREFYIILMSKIGK